MSKIKPGERMVLVLVCVFAFLLSVFSYAGKNRMASDIYPENLTQVKSEIIIKKYDTLPQPVKGYAEIEKNLNIPESLKNKPNFSGTAVFYVHFDDKGQVVDTLVARSLHEKLDNALLDAIKKTQWAPAYLNKKPVPAVVQIPIQVNSGSNGVYTLTLGGISKLAPPPPPPPLRKTPEPDIIAPSPPSVPVPATEVKVVAALPDVEAPPPPPMPATAIKADVIELEFTEPVQVAPLPKPATPIKVDAIAVELSPLPKPAVTVKPDVAIKAISPLPAIEVKALELTDPVKVDVMALEVAEPFQVLPPSPPRTTVKADVAIVPLPFPPPSVTAKPDVAIAPVPSPPAQKIKGIVAIETLPEPEGGMEAIKKQITLPDSFKRQIKHNQALIKVLVDAKGQVKEAEVVYGAADDEDRKKVENAVLAALKAVKWKPATQAGKPITTWVKITIKFD